MRLLAALTVALVLTGCAVTPKQLSRDEWRQTTQREYAATSDQVLNAAEKVLRLADGDDFTIIHQDNALHASRPWLVYLVLAAAMGTDTWRVETTQSPGATRASVLVSSQAGAVMPMPTTSPGVYTASGAPMAGNIVNGSAIYDVFWARMDWMLGRRGDWMDCKVADQRVKTGAAWGTNEALCNSFNITDKAPSENDRVIPMKS